MKNRVELAKYFAQLGFKKGAEIGVFEGNYSKTLLDNIPELNLLCVDSWSTDTGWGLAKNRAALSKATANLATYSGATLLRGSSVEVAKLVFNSSLDFVYIDADHAYASVKADIAAWEQKVRPGGIVSGHDYYINPDHTYGEFGVVPAVDEYVKKHNLDLKLSSDDTPFISWYFIKT